MKPECQAVTVTESALDLDPAKVARDLYYAMVKIDPMLILEKGNLVIAHPDNRAEVEALLAPCWDELQTAGLEVRYHSYMPKERAMYILDRSIVEFEDLLGARDGGEKAEADGA